MAEVHLQSEKKSRSAQLDAMDAVTGRSEEIDEEHMERNFRESLYSVRSQHAATMEAVGINKGQNTQIAEVEMEKDKTLEQMNLSPRKPPDIPKDKPPDKARKKAVNVADKPMRVTREELDLEQSSLAVLRIFCTVLFVELFCEGLAGGLWHAAFFILNP
nr:hypothetical protein Iba_chr02bCG25270 [Ipomoea batatas]